MPNTHSTLTSLFTDIADSIRAKTGSNGLITADNFPTAIDNLPVVEEYDGTVELPHNPYREKILSVQKLYDVGETNLTSDDIVQVNGIDYYVLQVDSANNKAELITKGIYDTRFNLTNTGAHTEYNYTTSDLKTWMDNFYTNQLGSDEYILESNVTSYYRDDNPSTDLTTFSTESLTQHVFALDAIEAKTNKNKFTWDYTKGFIDNPSSYAGTFWVSAGCKKNNYSDAYTVQFSGVEFVCYEVDESSCGARPAFWINLED